MVIDWAVIAVGVSMLSFIVAAIFYYKVSKLPIGNDKIEKVGKYIRSGSFAFLKRE